MAKIRMYNFVTADGFYAGVNDEIDWFDHERMEIDGQEDLEHLRPEVPRTLIFGRKTYEMMRQYWSSAQAMKDDPRTTIKMRESQKIVFSKTLDVTGESPTWKYVTLLSSIDPEHFRGLKENTAQDMTILGSGSIVRQFFDAGLLDELELMVVPVILAKGKLLLSQIEISKLTMSAEKKYQNGIVSRTYWLNS
jgi:dihydrofolate reductase